MNLSSPNDAFEPFSLAGVNFSYQAAQQIDPERERTSTHVTHNGTLLPADFEPSHYDVICGRGKGCANWVGNRRFRVTIAMNKEQYIAAPTKLDKSLVVDQLVKTIKSTSPNGGFIKKDDETGRWYKITDQQARDKVGHAMRDAVSANQKKAKRNKRRRSMRNKRKAAASARAPAPAIPIEAPSNFDIQPQPIQVSRRSARNSLRASIRASLRGSLKDADIAAFILETLGGINVDAGDISLVSESSLLRSIQDTAAVQV